MTHRPSRWHPVMLPDEYIRKMKQDLAEADALVESKTQYEPVIRPAAPRRATSESYYESFPDDPPPPDDDPQSA